MVMTTPKFYKNGILEVNPILKLNKKILMERCPKIRPHRFFYPISRGNYIFEYWVLSSLKESVIDSHYKPDNGLPV